MKQHLAEKRNKKLQNHMKRMQDEMEPVQQFAPQQTIIHRATRIACMVMGQRWQQRQGGAQ